MNMYDVEHRSLSDLLQEYTQDGDEKQRLLNLLNADSLLDLSNLEKMVYYRFYLGRSNKEIAEELDIPLSTVKTLRHNLIELYKKSKVLLLLGEMLFQGRPAKRKYSRKQPLREEIPGLDALRGNVTGFYSKDQLHDETHPIPHETVLILVVKQDEDKQWRFLVANKASKMITVTGDLSRAGFFKWDFPGGHVEREDGVENKNGQSAGGVVVGEPLPAVVHKNAAVREFREELRVKGRELDPDGLQVFYRSDYDGPTYPVGRNIETTTVYLYILPTDIRDNDVLVRDEWVDSLGEGMKKEFSSRFMDWETLEELYEKNEMAFMDGAGRVLGDVRKSPELKKRLFSLLSGECQV